MPDIKFQVDFNKPVRVILEYPNVMFPRDCLEIVSVKDGSDYHPVVGLIFIDATDSAAFAKQLAAIVQATDSGSDLAQEAAQPAPEKENTDAS